jgi:monoamine oxidase
VLWDVDRARRRFDRLARSVPPEAPWDAPEAGRLDGLTLADWVQENVRTARARKLFEIACGTVWGMRPERMSLLWALGCAASAGGFEALIDTEGGAQQDRVVGGSQLICERMAAGLGDSVVLDSPVERLSQDEGSVALAAAGVEVGARRAVIAMAPDLTARIEFSPALEDHDKLARGMSSGALTKCTAVYDEPFWRRDGLTGEALSDRGPITTSFDNSPPDGHPGVLVGFIAGPDAEEHARRPPSERRRRGTESLARLFGEGARHPRLYHEQAWAEERWSAGGPVSSPAPGVLTAHGAQLRRPAGRVHWAGAETASAWCGYMDGAVRSGERAAAEVLAAEGIESAG